MIYLSIEKQITGGKFKKLNNFGISKDQTQEAIHKAISLGICYFGDEFELRLKSPVTAKIPATINTTPSIKDFYISPELKPNEQEIELLTIFSEECAEFIESIIDLIHYGPHINKEAHREFNLELGDLNKMTELLLSNGLLEQKYIDDNDYRKVNLKTIRSEDDRLLYLVKKLTNVQQRISKTIRFGKNEIQSGQNLTNIQRIAVKFGEVNRVLLSLGSNLFNQNIIDEGFSRKEKHLHKFLQSRIL